MKLALIGYGKMGRAIEEIAIQRGHQVALIIDQHNLDDFTKENLSGIDAAIEFTGPHSALSNVQQMLEWGTPLVCSTVAGLRICFGWRWPHCCGRGGCFWCMASRPRPPTILKLFCWWGVLAAVR